MIWRTDNWRPEGWKNPEILGGYFATFEAGADAMLKALRETGFKTPKGISVIIPDDKGGDIEK